MTPAAAPATTPTPHAAARTTPDPPAKAGGAAGDFAGALDGASITPGATDAAVTTQTDATAKAKGADADAAKADGDDGKGDKSQKHHVPQQLLALLAFAHMPKSTTTSPQASSADDAAAGNAPAGASPTSVTSALQAALRQTIAQPGGGEAGGTSASSSSGSADAPTPTTLSPSTTETDGASTSSASSTPGSGTGSFKLVAAATSATTASAAGNASQLLATLVANATGAAPPRHAHDGGGDLGVTTALVGSPTPAPTLSALPVATRTLSLPVTHPQWPQAVAEAIVDNAGPDGGRLRLQLHPADLGPVDIALDIQRDRAKVQISALHDTTRTALQQAIPQLTALLAGEGLQLTHADVSSGQPQQQAPQGDASPTAANVGTSSSTISTSPSRIIALRNGLIDDYA